MHNTKTHSPKEMLSIMKMQLQSACGALEQHLAAGPMGHSNGNPQHSPLIHFKFDAGAFVPGPAHHVLLGHGKREVGHNAAAGEEELGEN